VTPPAAAACISGLQRGPVLEAGLAQARGKIDQARRHHQATGTR
jgi:hypothetical protein